MSVTHFAVADRVPAGRGSYRAPDGRVNPTPPGRLASLHDWSSVAWLDPLTDVAQPVRQSLVVVFRDAQAAALPAAEPAQLEEAGGEGRG